ncbi:variable large family protein [Borrelia puertoricensis]|uniref:variable large family protein n=1 Tax=Borrelia puertoricensis TaxID=2756107 RepID=UPI001FF1DFC3|nr:variable large family protein [Borrelia puertoricensis]UPA19233.1 variable large family protein [Borrelia puertoricensis]
MMKRITLCALFLTLFLLLSCGSGTTSAEDPKTTFLNSLVNIGHGFYEIFGIFGNAIGDALGLTAVKSGDKRSKVGEHFKTIGNGLTTTKNKLKELSDEISGTKNANSSTIDTVKGAISSASDVFEQLIEALTTLASVTNDSAEIGDTSNNAAAVAADENSVKTIIENVKTIIDVADKSDVKIEKGSEGNAVNAAANTDAPAVLTHNAAAGANAGPKLAAEVSKADPWAMIDKIKDSTVNTGVLTAATNYGAGELATGGVVANGAGAKTNADLAAAVALKAMTKTGKFSAAANEDGAVKAAAVSAVNKVLGILDIIIKKTVASELDKVGKAVKGIQYSETTTESTEASSTQHTATK